MSTRLFELARQKFADAAIDWNTDTIRSMLLDPTVADTHVKAVSGATNANPAVLTVTAHGWSNGDIVVVGGVGGNTAVNQVAKIANQATNTFELRTLKDALNVQKNGAFTTNGWVVNLTQTATLDQISAGRISTDVALTTPTIVNGVLDADDTTHTSVTGAVAAQILFKFVTNDAGSFPAVWQDGKQQVVAAADAASSATTLWVEPLAGAMPSGATLIFSNGITATLNGAVSAGARNLTVNALSGAIAAGHTAEAATTNGGFPFTGGGGSYTIQYDNGANKIIKL